jgi:hypothetical protein
LVSGDRIEIAHHNSRRSQKSATIR